MYRIANISSKDLSKIKINNQNKILELTGSMLSPLKAFEVIKRESKGFTEENDKAKQADELFYELLKRNGIAIEIPVVEFNDADRLRRSRSRERALKILELELELGNAA